MHDKAEVYSWPLNSLKLVNLITLRLENINPYNTKGKSQIIKPITRKVFSLVLDVMFQFSKS